MRPVFMLVLVGALAGCDRPPPPAETSGSGGASADEGSGSASTPTLEGSAAAVEEAANTRDGAAPEGKVDLLDTENFCEALYIDWVNAARERRTLLGLDEPQGWEPRYRSAAADLFEHCEAIPQAQRECLNAAADRITAFATCGINAGRDFELRIGLPHAFRHMELWDARELDEADQAVLAEALVGTWTRETRHGDERWEIAADGSSTLTTFDFEGQTEVANDTILPRFDGYVSYILGDDETETRQRYSFLLDGDTFYFARNVSSPPFRVDSEQRVLVYDSQQVVRYDATAHPTCVALRSDGIMDARARCGFGEDDDGRFFRAEFALPNPSLGGRPLEREMVFRQVGDHLVSEQLQRWERSE